MYQVIHPSYIQEWGKQTTLENIQVKLGKNKETCLNIVKDLLQRGVLTLIKNSESINLDINNDGKVDKEDFTKASKTLNKAKKLKK